jgi:hypothetical protein
MAYLGMAPTLVTLMGDDCEETMSAEDELREYMGGLDDDALDMAGRLESMGPFARQAALRQYPELMGIWPIIAKIAAGVAKGGAFIGKKIADEIKYKKKMKAKKAAGQQQVAAVENAAIAQQQAKAATQKKILIAAAVAVPVIGVGAFLVFRKRH